MNQTLTSFNVVNASCQLDACSSFLQQGKLAERVDMWKFQERCSSWERKLVENWGKNFREHVSRLDQGFPDTAATAWSTAILHTAAFQDWRDLGLPSIYSSNYTKHYLFMLFWLWHFFLKFSSVCCTNLSLSLIFVLREHLHHNPQHMLAFMLTE